MCFFHGSTTPQVNIDPTCEFIGVDVAAGASTQVGAFIPKSMLPQPEAATIICRVNGRRGRRLLGGPFIDVYFCPK